MGVSKAVLGEPLIAKAMIEAGIQTIADSRIENIERMKEAGIIANFVLLRTPLSRAQAIVESADISLNTEMETLNELSTHAQKISKIHKVIIMVELGDLREGVLPCDLPQFIKKALCFSHLEIVGIGCNLACYGGIEPDNCNMRKLSELCRSAENDFQLSLNYVSGGNSANYQWYQSADDIGRINNLRLGEAILLGCETVARTPIAGLYTQAFQLVAEVVESKIKPSIPIGKRSQDAFGNMSAIQDRGYCRRAIIALGRQDVSISGLEANKRMSILGASSDHLIVESYNNLQVGDEVRFNLSYSGLLSAMTSPFIKKQFLI